MKLAVNITEVLRNFSDYINRVAYRGERFILVRGGKPVAELSPVPSGTRLGDLPSLLASLPDPAFPLRLTPSLTPPGPYHPLWKEHSRHGVRTRRQRRNQSSPSDSHHQPERGQHETTPR